MDEVNDDRHLDVAGLGLGFDPLDLVVVAVHERDPGSAVLGVASVCLPEDVFDDGAGVLDDAGAQPLVCRDRSGGGPVVVVAGEDVSRGAGCRGCVVDGADLGHSLAAGLLGARQPGFGLGARAGTPGGGGGA